MWSVFILDNDVALEACEKEALLESFWKAQRSEPKADFSAATSAVSNHLTESKHDFMQRLSAQLEVDSSRIRASCAEYRDPSVKRKVSYVQPNEMMSATRLVCGG